MVLLNAEFLMTVLLTPTKYIAPPLVWASDTSTLSRSNVTLVELIHEMEPPFRLEYDSINVRLYKLASLVLIAEITPPFELDLMFVNCEFDTFNPLESSQRIAPPSPYALSVESM